MTDSKTRGWVKRSIPKSEKVAISSSGVMCASMLESTAAVQRPTYVILGITGAHNSLRYRASATGGATSEIIDERRSPLAASSRCATIGQVH